MESFNFVRRKHTFIQEADGFLLCLRPKQEANKTENRDNSKKSRASPTFNHIFQQSDINPVAFCGNARFDGNAAQVKDRGQS